jgi:hypothetical protein
VSPIDRDDPELTRKQKRAQARAERVAQEQALRTAAKRRKRLVMFGGAGAGAVAIAAVAAIGLGGTTSARTVTQHASAPRLALSSLASLGVLKSPAPSGSPGPEGVPIPNGPTLAGTSSMATGSPVDGAQCLGTEQLLFHIHAHLTLFVSGAARQLPYGIGITAGQVQNTPEGGFVGGGNCYYWLHTHAADGIIHIESPVQRTFTLGNLFDIWGQPLSTRQVGPATGRVTAIYNGKLYDGDPRNIPLASHAQIQLEVGAPLVAPVAVAFPNGL